MNMKLWAEMAELEAQAESIVARPQKPHSQLPSGKRPAPIKIRSLEEKQQERRELALQR